ncbi:MAG: hypothetical protein AAGU75_19090, partial [Bacillota bacterium]
MSGVTKIATAINSCCYFFYRYYNKSFRYTVEGVISKENLQIKKEYPFNQKTLSNIIYLDISYWGVIFMDNYILEMNHITKKFPGVLALDDVSFQ